jgi:predicted CXXCH cytochrome family protein
MPSNAPIRSKLFVGIVLAAGIIILAALGSQWRNREATRASHPTFIGSASCATCHAAEFAAWKTSQHSVAMQEARPGAVLGRFDSTTFSDAGVTTTFFRRGDRYIVQTEGADGRVHDFDVRYTFGVSPLQQYLIELPAGRVQALLIAWDTRPATDGGQRWFSLSPGVVTKHSDEFHWTGRLYNWNYMCADCHSTAVRKGYDPRTDQFHTTMSEINVACEACHGPGSAHASWGAYPTWVRRLASRGDPLPARFTERVGASWSIDSVTGNAHRSAPRRTDREIETCAQCHARRSHIADGYTAGSKFLDYYSPLFLTSGLYYPDGQQRDEVYTYASFLQSRMYNAGVTCADCHDPHTQKLRRPGNQVCAQCHRAAKYDTPAHHFHQTRSAGARCVSCHLPDTAYMQIDPRHDHSIRIPRPDLSVALGVPNACTRCHTNGDAEWAASQVASWYKHAPGGFQRFAGAFAADDRGGPRAADSLTVVATDASEPAIARASAIARLARQPQSVALGAVQSWTRDESPLIRLAALQVAETFPPDQRLTIATPLLADSARAIRQAAAWVLAPASATLNTAGQRLFQRAAAEFIASQRYNSDRASSRFALGAFYAQLGQLDSAVTELRAALQLSPTMVQSYLALAAVLREQGRVSEAVAELERATKLVPGDPQVAALLRSLTGREE